MVVMAVKGLRTPAIDAKILSNILINLMEWYVYCINEFNLVASFTYHK